MIIEDHKGIFIFRVKNGWAVYDSEGPFSYANGSAKPPMCVATSSIQLVQYVGDWSKAQEEKARNADGN